MPTTNKVVLPTYGKLEQYIDIFKRGGSNLLIIVGDYGVGKSRLAKKVLGEDHRLIENHVTAYRLYKELYEHRDITFLIDDVDQFYRDPKLVRLLKCLCNSEDVKSVSYHSYTEEIRSGELPSEFTTTSR